MGKQIIRYGNAKVAMHLYIYRQEYHYHPVYKVRRLPASRTGEPCDLCCKLVGSNARDGKAHIIKCNTKANERVSRQIEGQTSTSIPIPSCT
jgi:hypothetical protein